MYKILQIESLAQKTEHMAIVLTKQFSGYLVQFQFKICSLQPLGPVPAHHQA